MSSPQVLTPRVQALESQQLQLSNALASLQQSVAGTGSSGSGLRFYPVAPFVFANTTSTVAWTTVSSSLIPAGAVLVEVNGWVDNASGSTTHAFLYVRTNASDTSGLFIGFTRAGAGDTSGHAIKCNFPLSSTGTFDWSTNTSNMTCLVSVVGYWM